MLWLTSPFFCTESPSVILSCDPRSPLGSRERQGLGPLDPQQSSLLDLGSVLRFACMFARAARAKKQSFLRGPVVLRFARMFVWAAHTTQQSSLRSTEALKSKMLMEAA